MMVAALVNMQRRLRLLAGISAITMSSVAAAPPLPPDSNDFSLTDLEERNEEESKQNQAARTRWAEWQSRMASDFARVMKLDMSAEIVAEATNRFLDAYGADNPFSLEDEKLRGMAQRRRDAALAGYVEVALSLADVTYERQPSIVYPSISMRLRETGDVLVEVTVGSDGSILNARIQRSSGYQRLDTAALQAAQMAKFRPLPWKEPRLKASITIPFSFKLDG